MLTTRGMTRDEYVGRLKAELDRWNAQIADWEGVTRESQAGLWAQYDRHLRLLREQRDQALWRLEEVQSASDATWQELARGTDRAWDELRAAFKNAEQQFLGADRPTHLYEERSPEPARTMRPTGDRGN